MNLRPELSAFKARPTKVPVVSLDFVKDWLLINSFVFLCTNENSDNREGQTDSTPVVKYLLTWTKKRRSMLP